MNSRRWLIGVVAIAASLSLTSVQAAEQDAGSPPDARSVLTGMAKHLSSAPRFSVQMRAGYDAVQENGQKIEFLEKRTITLKRPDRLHVDTESSNGDRQQLFFDGQKISVVSTPQNVYAQAPRPGTVDDAVIYFLRDLKMRLPLALMLVTSFPDELARRVQSVDYVETTRLLGIPAHHIAARTDSMDFEVWIAEGSKPLPLRVVLTYRLAEGAPQFRAEFADWNFAPEAADAMFAFKAPQGAREIPFLTQVSHLVPAAPMNNAPAGTVDKQDAGAQK